MVEQLFGSKTRVKLLHLFLSNPDRAFYVREITRKIDEQINSVRRELANMLSIGVIKNDSVDNKLYYEVNKDYEHYTALQQMFTDSKTTSQNNSTKPKVHPWKKHIDQLTNVRLALLSGGIAGNPASQVDILLVGSPSLAQVKRLVKKFEEEEARPLNYAIMDYDNFYYRVSIKDKFINEIIDRPHIALIDSDNILQRQ